MLWKMVQESWPAEQYMRHHPIIMPIKPKNLITPPQQPAGGVTAGDGEICRLVRAWLCPNEFADHTPENRVGVKAPRSPVGLMESCPLL